MRFVPSLHTAYSPGPLCARTTSNVWSQPFIATPLTQTKKLPVQIRHSHLVLRCLLYVLHGHLKRSLIAKNNSTGTTTVRGVFVRLELKLLLLMLILCSFPVFVFLLAAQEMLADLRLLDASGMTRIDRDVHTPPGPYPR